MLPLPLLMPVMVNKEVSWGVHDPVLGIGNVQVRISKGSILPLHFVKINPKYEDFALLYTPSCSVIQRQCRINSKGRGRGEWGMRSEEAGYVGHLPLNDG